MTVSDLLAVPEPAAAEKKGAGARVRAHVNDSVTDSDLPGVAWARRAAGTVTGDFRSAWLWDACGPSPRSLWEARIPDQETVPGANRGLWVAWCAYNHAALAVVFPLLAAVWVLAHPARLLYTLPVVAPLAALWLV